jgi:Glycosyltransferase family 87
MHEIFAIKKSMILKLIMVAIGFAMSILISALFSYKIYDTDFPVYYFVASTILDRQSSNEDVYRYPEDMGNKYSIPEKKEVRDRFLYSIPAAYFLAPLALMPYYTAKSTMIFLNMIAFLFAVATILKLSNVSSRDITWGMAISCLWLPFLHTLVYAQINALILLLVALAVLAVTRGYPYLCGALFAVASLFKLFPFAIALVLGLRNWRVLVGFSVVFGASFLVPGSTKWISTVSHFVIDEMRSPIYLSLKAVDPVLVFLYPVLIGTVTALITIIAKDDDYPLLASFAIPAVFLAMPPLGYYHLTLLVFTYGYLFASKKYRNRILMGFLFFSAVVLGFPRPGPVSPFAVPMSPIMYFALFSLWVIIGVVISVRSFSRNPICKI